RRGCDHARKALGGLGAAGGLPAATGRRRHATEAASGSRPAAAAAAHGSGEGSCRWLWQLP
ncbi:unnamed protein product, partial [Effrenium voratum]